MDARMLNTIVNFIWGIADDCLRDVYVRGKYRDVILPMTVIRRLDAVLEDTKPQVLAAGLIAPFSVSEMPASRNGISLSIRNITLWSGSDGYPTAGRMPL